MIPNPSQLLLASAATLRDNILPVVADVPYAPTEVATIVEILTTLSRDFDRWPELIRDENSAMRALLMRVPDDLPSDLATTLRNAVAKDAGSIRVSALEAGNAALKAALIDLHAYVETRSESWAKMLDTDIWAFLRQSASERLGRSTTA